MHTFMFTFGDPSGDGHGKSKSLMINSEISSTDFHETALKISKYLPFSFDMNDKNSILAEHEDTNVPDDVLKWLTDNDINDYYKKYLFSIDSIEDGCYDVNDFAYLYLFCVAKTYEKIHGFLPKIYVDNKTHTVINYVGYGVFGY